MSNNTGLYLISKNRSSLKVNIWRLMYSPSAIADCQEVSNMDGFCYAQVMLSDSSFFFQALDTNTYYLRVLKMTYRSTSADWAYYVACPDPIWTTKRGEAATNSDSSLIYLLFVNGKKGTHFVYFVTLSSTNGSVVGSRYKSSLDCSTVFDTGVYGDYLFATLQCSKYSKLMIYNTYTNAFINRDPVSNLILNSLAHSPIDGR